MTQEQFNAVLRAWKTNSWPSGLKLEQHNYEVIVNACVVYANEHGTLTEDAIDQTIPKIVDLLDWLDGAYKGPSGYPHENEPKLRRFRTLKDLREAPTEFLKELLSPGNPLNEKFQERANFIKKHQIVDEKSSVESAAPARPLTTSEKATEKLKSIRARVANLRPSDIGVGFSGHGYMKALDRLQSRCYTAIAEGVRNRKSLEAIEKEVSDLIQLQNEVIR